MFFKALDQNSRSLLTKERRALLMHLSVKHVKYPPFLEAYEKEN